VPGRIDPALIPGGLTEIWYAPASCVCYHKGKFKALDGWDRLFRPIYMEDVDICHRAWRRGWRTLYVPSAVTYHLQHATTKKHSLRSKREFVVHRTKNSFLFTWKNLFHRRLLLLHFLWIPIHLSVSAARLDRTYLEALCLALKRIEEVIKLRRQEKMLVRQNDRDIFQKFSHLHVNEIHYAKKRDIESHYNNVPN
jgi:GT2 family glycosyltransferase